MDKKAIYNLSYGVFMVSTKAGEVANGCITNTCIQVASNPVRIAISVLNSNYTCDLIKESGIFAVSILDNDCTFETIKHFGFQSGRDVDKFGNITPPTDCNDVPYLGWQSCAVISGKVVEQHDLGTHTLFIAEVVDAKVLSDKEPITYAKYQNEIKPKNNAASVKEDGKKIVGWRCKICNYIYEGSKLPEDYACPLCGHGADDFEPIYES
ncbi:flavin reductase [Eubacterium ventriosum]|jgi:flavin reductase (DIM6/NTAB) family NADH-FMN oxidoreductase RutF/rubredoxin|uniref:Flavin reductase n=1 Tax=Eubacterium ventriosum TaxID=39496 RepID=A0A413RBK4_9FIRM|nr:flavin reductase [Eubacterium ventriosum]RHA19975.1 flavin reductase [Eubacterium ventriosum]